MPGVVTTTLAGENMHVVSIGKLPGQIGVTVPVKMLSGTTCRLNVPVSPALMEISVSWPLANVIWKSSPVPASDDASGFVAPV